MGQQNIIYLTPITIFTTNPFFYICFYSFLFFFLIASVLVVIFIVHLKDHEVIDNSGNKVYHDVNKNMIVAGLVFSILSFIFIILSFISYVRIFHLQKHPVTYLMIFLLILSVAVVVTSVFYYSKDFDSQLNICPPDHYYSQDYHQCVRHCELGSYYQPQNDQCIKGCRSDANCQDDDFCDAYFDCCPKENKCGLTGGPYYCCPPDECNKGLCCDLSRIIIDSSGVTMCCPEQSHADASGNKCVFTCGDGDDSKEIDINTVSCAKYVFYDQNTANNYYQRLCETESSCTSIKETTGGEYYFNLITPKKKTCVQGRPDQVFPPQINNFYSLIENNEIPSNRQFCTNGSDDVVWAQQDGNCPPGYSNPLPVEDGSTSQLNKLYTLHPTVFCGKGNSALEALVTKTYSKCDEDQAKNVCSKNAFSNCSFFTTQVDGNDITCFYTLFPPDEQTYTINPYSTSVENPESGFKTLETTYFENDKKNIDTINFKKYNFPGNTDDTTNQYKTSCDTGRCTTTPTADCCPSLIQGYEYYGCYISDNKIGYIKPNSVPLLPDITKFIQMGHSTSSSFNYSLEFSDNLLFFIQMEDLFDNNGPVSTAYWKDYNNNTVDIDMDITYEDKTTNCFDSLWYRCAYWAMVIHQPSINKYGDPDIVKAGFCDTGKSEGDYKYDTPFQFKDDLYVTIGAIHAHLDPGNNVSVNIFNSNSEGFTYKKRFGDSEHGTKGMGEPFSYFTINISKLPHMATNKKIKAQVDIGGGGYGFKINWNVGGWTPFDADDTIRVFCNISCNGPDGVTSIMVTDVTPNSFAGIKYYLGHDDKKVHKLDGEVFSYIAFSTKYLKDLTEIFPPYLPPT